MTGTARSPSPAPPSHTRNRATGLTALHWLTGLSAHFLKRPLKCLRGGRCIDLVSRPAGLFCSFGSREGVSRSFVLCSATFGQTLFLSKWQKKRKRKKEPGALEAPCGVPAAGLSSACRRARSLSRLHPHSPSKRECGPCNVPPPSCWTVRPELTGLRDPMSPQ